MKLTRQGGTKASSSTQVNDGQLLARIKDEFKKDPDVIAFKQEFDETREHLEHIKQTVRQPQDAARVAAQKHFDKLQQEYNDLWNVKYAEILDRLTVVGPGGDTQLLAIIQELEQKVESLKQKKTKLSELFKAIQVEQKVTNDDTFEATYLDHQVQSLLNWQEVVKKNLEQLKFEASQDKYRVVLVDPASAPKDSVDQKAAQVYGGRAGRRHVHDARTVSFAGDQGRASR